VAKILVVEDDRHTRDGLAELLREIGYEVCTAESGEQALIQAMGSACDLLITDLRLPGMSGLQLLQELESIGQRPQVILITAYDSNEVRQAAGRLGIRAVLQKPVNIEQLLKEIGETIVGQERTTVSEPVIRLDGG
jgi:DNA-binding response OmpR family regulator